MKKTTEKQICLIPIALWLVVIPLIVKLKFYANPLVDYPWYSSEVNLADFFLYYKSVFTTITGAIMLAVLIWQISKMRRKDTLINTDTRMFLPVGIYLILAIVSSLFSKYGYFCAHGMPDQFETLWNIIAYVVAMVYCYFVVTYHDADKPILGITFVGAALVGLICVLQYFKIDIYRMIYTGEGYSFSFEEGVVYGPFYNINYVGFYTLLLVPLFIALFICCKKTVVRVITALLTVALLIALVGAESLAADISMVAMAVFAVFFLLLKNTKSKKILWLPVGVLVAGAISVCVIALPRVNAYLAASNTEKTDLENIYTNDDNVEIDYRGQKLYIQMEQKDDALAFNLYDQDQNPISCEYQSSADGEYYYYTINDDRFSTITLTPAVITDDPTTYGFMASVDEKGWYFTNELTDDGTYYYYNDLGKICKLTPDTPSADFGSLVNKSSLANGRGYIWNKTMTILKDYIFVGSGADTFALVYPNGDFVDKYNNGYDNLIITRPHCMYLQIAVQSGVLSLICFLVFYIWYFISSLRLYYKQRLNNPLVAAGFGILLGTMGYMISALANDSTITVAPVYWGLLGIGIGINHRIRSSAS